MDDVRKQTEKWIDTIINEFGNYPQSALNQVYMKGYFAGWSIRDVLRLANQLKESNEKYPLNNKK